MNISILIKELKFKAIRSSGSGGQHVNKVASKIELCFNLADSKGLTDKEKSRLIQKLDTRLTKTRILYLQCGETRSQHRNKELIIKRFLNILRVISIFKKQEKRLNLPEMQCTKGWRVKRNYL